MTTLVIRSRKKAALKKLISLAAELELEVTSLGDEQKEELAMLKAIQAGLGTAPVSRESVMRVLRRA